MVTECGMTIVCLYPEDMPPPPKKAISAHAGAAELISSYENDDLGN